MLPCTSTFRLSVGKMSTQKGLGNVDENSTNITLRRDQEINNPCHKEHILSLKCLETNQKKPNECELYFLNYKNCKQFWATVKSERRAKGIKPYLPPLEERTKIKADFLNSR